MLVDLVQEQLEHLDPLASGEARLYAKTDIQDAADLDPLASGEARLDPIRYLRIFFVI